MVGRPLRGRPDGSWAQFRLPRQGRPRSGRPTVRLDTASAFVRPWPADGTFAPSRNPAMDGRTNPVAERRLSLVLPAFNEEAGVRQAVVEADDALAALCDDYEILVVDDGSRDATAAVVAELTKARPRVRLLRHETNRGYGAALRTGFEAARFDLVAFTDADCQFYLADLDRLISLTDHCPVAVGWREARARFPPALLPFPRLQRAHPRPSRDRRAGLRFCAEGVSARRFGVDSAGGQRLFRERGDADPRSPARL